MASTEPVETDWRDWPEPKKRQLRARLLELTQRPWREVARAEQLPPLGEWYIWFLVGGRGAGKTRSGAEWLAEELQGDGPGDESAILAPTFGDARDRCVEGPSGLLRALGTSRAEVEAGRSWTVERWNRSMGELRLRSGAVVHIDGADDGALRIQGGNFRRAWCDELRLWKQAIQAWDESLLPAVRLGTPHIVVTSTPKPTRLVKRLLKDTGVVKSHMTTYENEANLAPAFLAQMRSRYEGTRLGRQELHGVLLEDVEGALWRADWIDNVQAVGPPAELTTTIVGLDPADGLEDGDEQGIAVVGAGLDRLLYVIESDGMRDSPLAFCKRGIDLAVKHRGRIVVEKNHGGQFLVEVLELAMKQGGVRVPYRTISASQRKRTRAEPVAALYEQRRVKHVGVFPELEEQLTSTTFEPGKKSPDRLDALVWALSELMGYGGPVSAEDGAVVPWSDQAPVAGDAVVAWE